MIFAIQLIDMSTADQLSISYDHPFLEDEGALAGWPTPSSPAWTTRAEMTTGHQTLILCSLQSSTLTAAKYSAWTACPYRSSCSQPDESERIQRQIDFPCNTQLH